MTRGGLFRSAIGAAAALVVGRFAVDGAAAAETVEQTGISVMSERLDHAGVLFKPNTKPFYGYNEPTITRSELREIFGYDDALDRFWQIIAASYTEEELRELDRLAQQMLLIAYWTALAGR